MNTKSTKVHQVVSAGNKTDVKQRKNEKFHQFSCSGVNETSKGGRFLTFCQDSAQKYFQEKTLHSMDCSTDPGN